MARQQVARQGESFHTLRREAGAVGLGVVGLIVALAIVTYDPETGMSLVGPAGAAVAEVLGQVLGLAAYAIPLGLLSWAVLIFLGRTPEHDSGAQARLVLFGQRAGSLNAGIVVRRVLGLRNLAELAPAAPPSDAPAWYAQRWMDADGRGWQEVDLARLARDPLFLQVGV